MHLLQSQTRKSLLTFLLMVSLIFQPFCLQAGFLDGFKDTAKGVKFLWGEKKPFFDHLGHIKGAIGDMVRDSTLYGNFTSKLVDTVKNVKSFIGDTRSLSFNKISETVGHIDFLTSKFGTIWDKTVSMVTKYKPDVQYFMGVHSRFTDKITSANQGKPNQEFQSAAPINSMNGAVSYFEPGFDSPSSYGANLSANSQIQNDIFKESRMEKFSKSVGLFNGIRKVFTKPSSLFKFGEVKSAYAEGELGAKIGFKVSALIENVSLRILAMKDQIKELLDVKKHLNGLMSSFLGGSTQALAGFDTRIRGMVDNSVAIISSLKRNVPALRTMVSDYTQRFGNPLDKVKNAFSSNSSSSNPAQYQNPPSQSSGFNAGSNQDVSLKEAHDNYNRLFENYRSLVRSGTADPTTLQRSLDEVRRAKWVLQNKLK